MPKTSFELCRKLPQTCSNAENHLEPTMNYAEKHTRKTPDSVIEIFQTKTKTTKLLHLNPICINGLNKHMKFICDQIPVICDPI